MYFVVLTSESHVTDLQIHVVWYVRLFQLLNTDRRFKVLYLRNVGEYYFLTHRNTLEYYQNCCNNLT